MTITGRQEAWMWFLKIFLTCVIVLVPLSCNDGDDDSTTTAPSPPDNGEDPTPTGRPGDDDQTAPGDDDMTSGLSPTPSVDRDGDGYSPVDGDCNDMDATVYPNKEEVCDGRDDDCDGTPDDPFLDPDNGTSQCVDDDGDGYTELTSDCNDLNVDIRPGRTEICNGIDDNCNQNIDESFDIDADGWVSCPVGSRPGDCNDVNASVNPGATEVCDGIDNDCSGTADDGLPDLDGDSFNTCVDCDDTEATTNPGAVETCNGVDDDCDNGFPGGEGQPPGGIDEDFDKDGDGHVSCTVGTVSGDCNDSNAAIYPGQSEICDSVDNNCNNLIDEGLPTTVFYRDDDGDSYGVDGSTVTNCARPSGYATLTGDCNDGDASSHPGAREICDEKDNDCNGSVDETCWDITSFDVGLYGE